MKTSTIVHDANEFSGKRILVTGGTKGIGEAAVNRLRRGGGTVLPTARSIAQGGIFGLRQGKPPGYDRDIFERVFTGSGFGPDENRLTHPLAKE